MNILATSYFTGCPFRGTFLTDREFKYRYIGIYYCWIHRIKECVLFNILYEFIQNPEL